MNSNCSYSPEYPQFRSKSAFLSLVTLKFDGWPWNTIGHHFYAMLSCIISKPLVNSILSYSPEALNSCQNLRFFAWCELEIWQLTLKNKMTPLLCCFKLCASFDSHQWIHTGVIVRKRQIWVKIDDFLSCVTCKFDRWPWKTIGHLSVPTEIIVHHFVAIGEFKLELQSRKSPNWVKIGDFFVTCDLEIRRIT